MESTLSEANVWKSVKKFFVDGFPDKTLFFDYIEVYGRGTINSWICILKDNLFPKVVSECNLNIYICCKKDNEGDDLASLRDEVIDLIYEADNKIVLYETSVEPWIIVGGMVVRNLPEGTTRNIADIKLRALPCVLKWGATWS